MGVIANWSLLYRMLTNTLLMEIETYHEIDLSANSLTLRTEYLHASWKKKNQDRRRHYVSPQESS